LINSRGGEAVFFKQGEKKKLVDFPAGRGKGGREAHLFALSHGGGVGGEKKKGLLSYFAGRRERERVSPLRRGGGENGGVYLTSQGGKRELTPLLS